MFRAAESQRPSVTQAGTRFAVPLNSIALSGKIGGQALESVPQDGTARGDPWLRSGR